MTQKKKQDHKPVIETLINSAALALFAFGTGAVLLGDLKGYIAMAFGMIIEFFKYWGRKKEFW